MKKTSTIIIIIIFLFLGVLSIYVYKNKNVSGTVDTDARNFKYKDTGRVTKIFIADKEGDQSTIERTKSGWVVNGKFPCRSDAILNLFEAIKNVEVKMPVQKKSREGVLKIMASSALKVEIYAGDDLVRQYYVGHETPDSEGSYMLLTDVGSGKNYDEPFVCFIPGFIGYLIPRFIAKENEWRDRLVINLIPPQIRQIKVDHLENPDSSFTIEVLNTRSFQLKDSKNRAMAFDEFKMKQYLAYFQNISYEALFTGKNQRLCDSLVKAKPFEMITISRTDFKTDVFKFYHRPAPDTKPEHGVVYKYDPDRMYLSFGSDKEWAVIQNFVFGKLLANPDYFLPSSVKK